MACLAGPEGAGALERDCPVVDDLPHPGSDPRTGLGLAELVDACAVAAGAGELASAYASGSTDYNSCIQLGMRRPWTVSFLSLTPGRALG